MKIAVTGAFSYSGKYIAKRLLARGEEVITLTGHPDRPDPFGGKVKAYPLDFDEARMTRSLQGVEVLVNTYWVRFDKGENTQPRAVENTRRLVSAAKAAGVKRIVHISLLLGQSSQRKSCHRIWAIVRDFASHRVDW
jgi:NADH dehydrogenase